MWENIICSGKRDNKLSDDCTEQINALNNCITGELRIGVGSFIAPYIRRTDMIFMERYPNVKINVEFSKVCRLNQMLREHKIDLAFTMKPMLMKE